VKYKTINLFGLRVSFLNWREVAIVLWDIFIRKEYHFNTDKKDPFILDCGAHIGLSTLYFKRIYPEAKITAFEPNPKTFELLKLNISQNNLKDVKLKNAALSDKKGEDTLYISKEDRSPWTWGDAIVRNKWNESENSKKIRVKTVKLSEYINRKVDFLKLDIEGAETRVLEEVGSKLSQVKEMVMEFHGSSTNKENSLQKILEALESNNFTYKIKQGWRRVRMVEIRKTDPYWLIIYAKRIK